jgi:DNA polymerase-3 subunit gamma/tau
LPKTGIRTCFEMDAASRTGIDDIREIMRSRALCAVDGALQGLSSSTKSTCSPTAAFNALLKTLEEPPPHVKFVFATTEIRKVPVTVLSRCQRFDLKRVEIAVLNAHFKRIAGVEDAQIDDDALTLISRAAEGSVRDGLSLLDQAIAHGAGQVNAELVRDMLGLADRGLALELMQALMAGDTAAALALTESAHAGGTDPAVMLSDLLELVHLLSRMKTVPALKDDPALPEAERSRGAALAESLSIPVLARAWQILLKGLQEVAQDGVNRRAAAEMVLIRLAHVADLPTPGDLVRRLTDQNAAASPAPAAPPGGGGGLRAIAGGGGTALAMAAPAPAPAPAPAVAPMPQPSSFREIVALASGRKPSLHAHLRLNVHPVRISPGRIEIRPRPEAPRDLAQQLTAFLQEATGTRWTVTLVNEGGEPTLAEQGRTAEADRLTLAESHPLVQAVLAAFPGAKIEAVRDASVDAYGLAPAMVADLEDGRDFAPPDAEAAGLDDDLTQED